MNKIFYPCLYAVAMVSTIYYNGLNNNIAKVVSMIILGVLFVCAFYKAYTIRRYPKVFISWLFWIIMALFVNLMYGMSKYGYEQLFNISIAMPLMTAFASYYTLDIKKEKLPYYIFPVCLLSAYFAIQSVYTGLGGFFIAANYDVDIAKNQIGATFTSMGIICAAFALERIETIFRILYVLLSVICVYPALFLTCRTALLAYFIVVAFLLIRDYGWKNIFVAILIIFIVITFAWKYNLNSLLYESIVGNRDASDVDDLTSGRFKQAASSVDYFLGHPFWGYYGSGVNAGTVPPAAHIYLLFRLTMWGIIGAIPAIALYFSIFKIFIRSIKRRNLLVAGLLSLAFIESFSEFAPPFGPGSCFIVTFVILGYYLRQESNNYQSTSKKQ
jgi:hypothetical protein